jgi:hypothetical protein
MQLLFGPMNANLVLRYNDEAAHPFLYIFRLKKLDYLTEESLTSRSAKPDKNDSMMHAWLKMSIIGKIQVLRNQETLFILTNSPYGLVSSAAKSFGINGFNVVAYGA